MASKTANKNAGIRGAQRSRFLVGTDTPVIRVMDGKRHTFYWGVKEDGGGYRRLEKTEYELR